jgi:hypothetical protein
MTKLPDGLYDLLVTQAIQREMAKAALARADEHGLLLHHAAEEREVLLAIDALPRLRDLPGAVPSGVAVDDPGEEPDRRSIHPTRRARLACHAPGPFIEQGLFRPNAGVHVPQPGNVPTPQRERPLAIVWRLSRPMPLDVFGIERVGG